MATQAKLKGKAEAPRTDRNWTPSRDPRVIAFTDQHRRSQQDLNDADAAVIGKQVEIDGIGDRLTDVQVQLELAALDDRDGLPIDRTTGELLRELNGLRDELNGAREDLREAKETAAAKKKMYAVLESRYQTRVDAVASEYLAELQPLYRELFLKMLEAGKALHLMFYEFIRLEGSIRNARVESPKAAGEGPIFLAGMPAGTVIALENVKRSRFLTAEEFAELERFCITEGGRIPFVAANPLKNGPPSPREIKPSGFVPLPDFAEVAGTKRHHPV